MATLEQKIMQQTQSLLDYQNAVNNVTAYVYAVATFDEPTPPAGLSENELKQYQNFVQKLQAVKTQADIWQDDLVTLFTDIPKAIVDFNTLFVSNAQDIQSYIQSLQQNPNQPNVIQALQKALTDTASDVESKIQLLTGLQQKLNNFSSGLSTAEQGLTQAVQFIYSVDGAVETQIASLNVQITQLQSDLKKYQAELGGAIAGTVVSFFLLLNPFTFVFGLAGLGGSIYGDIEADAEITATNAKIETDRQKLDTLNQVLTTLQALANQVQGLEQTNQTAQTAMATVLETWNELAADLQNVATLLGDTANATSLQQAATDLQQVLTAWSTLTQLAQDLTTITYNPPTQYTLPS